MLFKSAFTRLTTILFTVLQYLNPWNNSNAVSECNTAACQNFANRIISAINPDVKPCDNFYQFACGNFMKGADVFDKITRLGGKQDEIDEQIKNLLQEKANPSEPQIFKFVKRYFQNCVDENKMNARGAAPGFAMLKKLGGWPVLGNWDSANWNILETAISSFQLGLEGYNVIALSTVVDFTDKTKYNTFIMVNPPYIPYHAFLLKGEENSVVKKYSQYLVDMAVMFGTDSQTAEEAMEKVIKLQIELAKVVPLRSKQDTQFTQFTLRELDGHPNKLLDWRKLFEGMVSPIKLQDDQKIVFHDLEVIEKVLTLINGYPAETVANYVMWNFALKMSPYLTTKMRGQGQLVERMMDGIIDRQPRWEECLQEVKGLGVALSAMYVNKFFDKSSRNKAKDMTDRIQKEMDRALLEADWMDKETRSKAQQKSAQIHHVVGYPDELADMAKVKEYYKELNLDEEHYFEARLGVNKVIVKNNVKKLNMINDKRSWKAFSMMTSANAFYDSSKNAIVVPAGILQEPVFSASVPSYLNYASIGFIIGHEITHAFDNEGRGYDGEGEEKEWWDETSLNTFNEKKECFIDQYNSFIESVSKLKMNGLRTQGENIADNGGLKLSYRAYRQMAKQLRKPEPGLPGLKHYNNDELFFISLANTWCATMTFIETLRTLRFDVHSPPECRVNGMVMNMPQFTETFGCDKGAPMNPTERCEIW